MSLRQHEIGLTALLELYPPDGPADPNPTSPAPATLSCVVYGPGGEQLAVPSVTADSASQTVTAVRGLRELTGTSTGFIVGRRYWLSSAGGGYGYADRVEDKATGKIYLANPAKRDYTGGTLKGLRLSASITAPAVPMRNCRVVWRYNQLGEAKSLTELVDFVRLPFLLGLTPAVLDEVSGTLAGDLGASGDWDGLIERADREAYAWLSGQGLRPELVIDRQGLTSAYAWRVLALRYVGTTDERYDRYQAEHERALSSYSQARGWYDNGDTLSATSIDSKNPPSALPARVRIA
jgi:hypothetical protein